MTYMDIDERRGGYGRDIVFVCDADWEFRGYYAARASGFKRSGFDCGRGYAQFPASVKLFRDPDAADKLP